jgi:hypothetical protein
MALLGYCTRCDEYTGCCAAGRQTWLYVDPQAKLMKAAHRSWLAPCAAFGEVPYLYDEVAPLLNPGYSEPAYAQPLRRGLRFLLHAGSVPARRPPRVAVLLCTMHSVQVAGGDAPPIMRERLLRVAS